MGDILIVMHNNENNKQTKAQRVLENLNPLQEHMLHTPLQIKRWLHALDIAKILFEDQGYHSQYLNEIQEFIRQGR